MTPNPSPFKVHTSSSSRIRKTQSPEFSLWVLDSWRCLCCCFSMSISEVATVYVLVGCVYAHLCLSLSSSLLTHLSAYVWASVLSVCLSLLLDTLFITVRSQLALSHATQECNTHRSKPQSSRTSFATGGSWFQPWVRNLNIKIRLAD